MRGSVARRAAPMMHVIDKVDKFFMYERDQALY
jgi:hypothetical protein